MGVQRSGGYVNRFWCCVAATALGMATTAPVLAATQDTATENWWWLGAGIGAAQRDYGSAAPGDTAFAFTLEAGMQITPHWGLGLELGANMAGSGCDFCGPYGGSLNTEFDHFFLVGEYRPREYGWRLRAGVGVSAYDLSYGYGMGYPSYTVNTFGAGLSAGYQWRLGTVSPLSLGVRLSGEAAHFPARRNLDALSLQYSAVTLTLQLTLN
jgi:Outer membrane protein beta-barrel domain